MTQTQTHVCSRCGKSMLHALSGTSCPQCLLALAMIDGSNDQTTGPHRGAADEDHVPPAEKLVSVFPDLEIQHLVGHGGMGAVYQARQINLDRIVALKILSPRLSRDPAFAERFLREARTLARLSHRNIVTVFDFGKAGEFYYLTMEFVDGVNLRDTISAQLLTTAEALAIVPQVCEALQYAHDNGVVHRDIKPENILIAKNGDIKIADFGLAKLLQPNPENFTLTGTRQVLGTRNYMAPEQIESPDVVDHRADLYSLGVVFYELLTGELPLGRFSLPSEKSKSVSNQLDDVVMRTLEKDPNRRYQQASQIKTACEELDRPQRSAPQGSAPQGSAPQDGLDGLDLTPLCKPFPITIGDLVGGLAAGYGLLRGFESHLELEFEVRDTVVDHRWSSGIARIPLVNISSIKLYQGMIYTHIEVQADGFEVVNQIPNSKHGKFKVYLKKDSRETAQLLVGRVNDIIGIKLPPTPPMPPVKTHFESHSFASTSNGWANALWFFLVVGLCIFLGMSLILGSILLSYSAKSAPESSVSVSVSDVESVNPVPVVKPEAEESTSSANEMKQGSFERETETAEEAKLETEHADRDSAKSESVDDVSQGKAKSSSEK